MCGFCGYITADNSKEEKDIVRMATSISRRGPDHTGYYFAEGIAIAHRRLTILDVSNASNQPFHSSCGNYVMVFNGEIYNYRELYKKMKIAPRTSGDTEVILELFIQYGPQFVSMLNGMFAFVILDKRNNHFYLFRDRLGVKPLFYAFLKDTLIFGSEIKAIRAYDKTALSEINRAKIADFFHLGFIPEPDTIYSSIKKFPSAHYAIIKNRTEINFVQYWNIEDKISSETIKDEAKAKEELKSLLISSVGYRMISDVPLGTFLSGGIDSSLVTAIAQNLSDKPVNTFSIGFHESGFNESGHAKKIANYLGTNHHELIVSEQDGLDHLMDLMDDFDEPFIDTSALPVYMVSKLASKQVKVVLSGDGGDELFMGYGSYNWAERLNKPHIALLKKIFYLIFKHSNNDRLKSKAEMFNEFEGSRQSHLFSQQQLLFTVKEIHKYFNLPSGKNIHNIGTESIIRKLTPAEQQSLFDIAYYLKDDLLVKIDRMTMYNSIEGREPLLDYRLLEYSVNLDPGLKIRYGTNKFLLKKVLYDYIPEEYFNRPKWGFSIPLKDWLRTKLHFLIEEYLSKDIIEEVGIIDPVYSDMLVKRFEAGESNLYHKIWQLVIAHRFLRLKR